MYPTCVAEAPDGDYPTRMQIWDMHPGGRAFVQQHDDGECRVQSHPLPRLQPRLPPLAQIEPPAAGLEAADVEQLLDEAFALQAAHIRPYAQGGEHWVTNGLTLRSDMHTLYDRGYIGIDTDYRLRVSPRLNADFGNGVELYSREARGDVIALPDKPDLQPDRESLAWHMDTVFLSA